MGGLNRARGGKFLWRSMDTHLSTLSGPSKSGDPMHEGRAVGHTTVLKRPAATIRHATRRVHSGVEQVVAPRLRMPPHSNEPARPVEQ